MTTNTTGKKGERITAVTDAQLHFQKHKNPNMVY